MSQQLKALIIDDDKLVQFTHSIILKKLGYFVTIVTDGKEGLNMVRVNNEGFISYPNKYCLNIY